MITSNRTIHTSKGLLNIAFLLLSWSFWSALSFMPTTLKPPKNQSDDETTTSAPTTSTLYKIVGIPGGHQYLPASYVKDFSRWTIEEVEEGEKDETVKIGTSSESCSYKLVPLDDTEDECPIEQPQETADTISMQPTINFLVQAGVPTNVFVGLVVVSRKKTDTQQKRGLSLTKEDLRNNHLAQQWTKFDKTAHPFFRVEVFWGPGDGTDADQIVGIVDPPTVQSAIEHLGNALATTENQDLSTGFHLVTIPLPMDMSSSSINFQQQPKEDAPILLTCLALAEPNARELLKLDLEDDTIAFSKLQVDAAEVLSTV